MAVLWRAIVACNYAEQFEESQRVYDAWPGVTDALQMAASIDDVFTDPAFVDDSDSWMFCETVGDRDREDRERASKYTAAMITFNFAWNAYEAAIEISAGTAFPRDKIPVRARRLFQAEPKLGNTVQWLPVSYRVARHICSGVPELKSGIEDAEKEYGLVGPAAAAELCRLFRNYVIHGRDDSPTVESNAPYRRFYSITRLLLLLVQLLVLRRVRDPVAAVPLSANWTADETTPAGLYLSNAHRRLELWLPDPAQADLFA